MANDHSNHVPVGTGTVPPAPSVESREIGRPVMESSECSESKSDLGLGIINTVCLFSVAGSDWWVNYTNLLVDIGLKHEIDESREAERYKFGDGGTLVSFLPNKRAGGKSRSGRGGRHFMERGRCPRPRSVVDFTGGSVADLTQRSTPDSKERTPDWRWPSINLSIHPTINNVRTNVATLNPVAIAKPGTKKKRA